MPVLPPRRKKKKPEVVAKARAMAAIRTGDLKSMEKTGWRHENKMLIYDVRKKYPRLKRRVNPIKTFGMGENKATMPKWGRPKRHPVRPARINPEGIT